MTKHSDNQLVSNENLAKHFESHFSERNIKIQPEVTNPENYPHILPPDNVQVNTDIPNVIEVKDIMKNLKSGKCLGTDLLHPEHLKYNTSNRFFLYLIDSSHHDLDNICPTIILVNFFDNLPL